MKKYTLALGFLVMGAFVFYSCDATSSKSDLEPITISGEVINRSTESSIENAIVQITAPTDLQQLAETDSNGEYVFTDVQVDSVIDVTIEATKEGFNTVSLTLVAVPERDIDVPAIQLSDGTVDDGDSGGVGGESGGAAAMILTSISDETINIAETGGNVNTSFTFALQDSAGRTISSDNSLVVDFEIISGPGGGESITPESGKTNSSGSITSNLFAGNVAGVVQIQATAVRDDIGLTIQSRPVAITIHGGFPDINHFSLGADVLNFEGYNINGNTNEITAIVGDKFSNPVKPGTAVYFSSTGGVIEGSASGHTDDQGYVTVDLISTDPRPNDNITGSGGRPGYATITAKTVNEDNVEIEKDINIVFSTSEAIISANPTTFDLAPNGGESFTYTVTDLNGNPMPTGTSIVIDAGGDLEVTGDSDFTLGNHLFPGPGSTEFNFSIRDTDEDNSDPAPATIKIEVTSPSGNTSTYSGIQGTRRKTIR